MFNTLLKREIGKGKRYIVLCNDCGICISNQRPIICYECSNIIWCSNCKRYDSSNGNDWICTECSDKYMTEYLELNSK